LENRVLGGLGTQTFNLVTRPSIYGTNCGPQYNETNQGIFFGTGANSSRVFYCPPANFYTGHNTAGVDVIDLSFEYEVTDQSGQVQSEPVTFAIDPDNSDALLTDVQNGNGLQYTYIGNLGQDNVSLPM